MPEPKDHRGLHFYIVRCEHCPQWYQVCNYQPVKAERTAMRHSRDNPGHSVVVIDITSLQIVSKFSHEALPLPANNDPPF